MEYSPEIFLNNLAQTNESPFLISIERAEGIYLYSPEGKRYTDLISGIGVSNIGHRHPHVIQAIKNQLDKHLHVMVFGEYIQSSPNLLARKLTSILPPSLNNVAEDGIFIGTDATERWNKQQFYTFAKPYFDKGKAWDFKAYDRTVHVSNNGQFVWFSELLTTWMGVCRGSGTLEKTANGWKIHQYHLAVTVPNDLVRDFLTLVANFEKAKK